VEKEDLLKTLGLLEFGFSKKIKKLKNKIKKFLQIKIN